MKPERFFIAYLIGALICFGPAMVESERANPNSLSVDVGSLAFVKAACWPFWLSYAVARNVL